MTIRQIEPAELGHFGLDEVNRLYWDGKAIQTESVVVLSGKQTTWGILIAVATVLSAMAAWAYSGTYLYVTFKAAPAHTKQADTSNAAGPAPSLPCATPTPVTLPQPSMHQNAPPVKRSTPKR